MQTKAKVSAGGDETLGGSYPRSNFSQMGLPSSKSYNGSFTALNAQNQDMDPQIPSDMNPSTNKYSQKLGSLQ
jgi:hypothetical protein